MPAIGEVARRYGVVVIEDCAQAHGADIEGRKVGCWGDMAAFSFFPTKNLGGLGDGGMVVTDDPVLSEQARRIRQYGWDAGRVSQRPGMNSRLDELQAALLRVKLTHLNDENQRRRERAEVYRTLLDDIGIALPVEPPGFRHVYHQFVVRTPLRDRLRRWLLDQGVETSIHYPLPIHLQPAFANPHRGSGGLAMTERMAAQVVSLPIFPQLDIRSVQQVATAIREWHTTGRP
jgi:dTDP-4-amino-4,6-dideoxygalactose transaminase